MSTKTRVFEKYLTPQAAELATQVHLDLMNPDYNRKVDERKVIGSADYLVVLRSSLTIIVTGMVANGAYDFPTEGKAKKEFKAIAEMSPSDIPEPVEMAVSFDHNGDPITADHIAAAMR